MDGLIIGLDLCDAYTRLCCHEREKTWCLPTVICRKKDDDEWYVGEEAYAYTLVGEGTVYYWYGGDVEARQAPADEKSPDLDGPHIPTYEDVLAVDTASITDTGYEEKGGLDCVYVQVEDAELGYQTRYWISVDSRLLVAAETVKDGQAVMSMSGYSLEQPVASGTQFSLPDGTVLHTS